MATLAQGKKLHALIEFMAQVHPLQIGNEKHFAVKTTYTYSQLLAAFKKSLKVNEDEIQYLCSILVFDGLAETLKEEFGKKMGKHVGISIHIDKIRYAYQSKQYLKAYKPEFSWWRVLERAGIIGGILGGITALYFIYDRYNVRPQSTDTPKPKTELPLTSQDTSKTVKSDSLDNKN